MRGNFSSCKAEAESGLTPADNENTAGREMGRIDVCFFNGRTILATVILLNTAGKVNRRPAPKKGAKRRCRDGYMYSIGNDLQFPYFDAVFINLDQIQDVPLDGAEGELPLVIRKLPVNQLFFLT